MRRFTVATGVCMLLAAVAFSAEGPATWGLGSGFGSGFGLAPGPAVWCAPGVLHALPAGLMFGSMFSKHECERMMDSGPLADALGISSATCSIIIICYQR